MRTAAATSRCWRARRSRRALSPRVPAGDYFRRQGEALPQPPFVDEVVLDFGIADAAGALPRAAAGVAVGLLDVSRVVRAGAAPSGARCAPAASRSAESPSPSPLAARAVEPYALDWLNLLIRWVHLIMGIAWIGSSFYFVWLDNTCCRPSARRTPTRGWAASCGRCTAAGSTTCRSSASRRRSCPRRCTGSSGRPTRRGCRASHC